MDKELPKKKVVPRYEYSGIRFRDPFIPLNSNNSLLQGSKDIIVPNIDTLTLKGIFYDEKVKMALLSGGGVSYVLQDNRLYDNRRRAIPQITGDIKQDSVIVYDSNKKFLELRLRDKK